MENLRRDPATPRSRNAPRRLPNADPIHRGFGSDRSRFVIRDVSHDLFGSVCSNGSGLTRTTNVFAILSCSVCFLTSKISHTNNAVQ